MTILWDVIKPISEMKKQIQKDHIIHQGSRVSEVTELELKSKFAWCQKTVFIPLLLSTNIPMVT